MPTLKRIVYITCVIWVSMWHTSCYAINIDKNVSVLKLTATGEYYLIRNMLNNPNGNIDYWIAPEINNNNFILQDGNDTYSVPMAKLIKDATDEWHSQLSYRANFVEDTDSQPPNKDENGIRFLITDTPSCPVRFDSETLIARTCLPQSGDKGTFIIFNDKIFKQTIIQHARQLQELGIFRKNDINNIVSAVILFTLKHELGHALGLGHPDTGAGPVYSGQLYFHVNDSGFYDASGIPIMTPEYLYYFEDLFQELGRPIEFDVDNLTDNRDIVPAPQEIEALRRINNTQCPSTSMACSASCSVNQTSSHFKSNSDPIEPSGCMTDNFFDNIHAGDMFDIMIYQNHKDNSGLDKTYLLEDVNGTEDTQDGKYEYATWVDSYADQQKACSASANDGTCRSEFQMVALSHPINFKDGTDGYIIPVNIIYSKNKNSIGTPMLLPLPSSPSNNQQAVFARDWSNAKMSWKPLLFLVKKKDVQYNRYNYYLAAPRKDRQQTWYTYLTLDSFNPIWHDTQNFNRANFGVAAWGNQEAPITIALQRVADGYGSLVGRNFDYSRHHGFIGYWDNEGLYRGLLKDHSGNVLVNSGKNNFFDTGNNTSNPYRLIIPLPANAPIPADELVTSEIMADDNHWMINYDDEKYSQPLNWNLNGEPWQFKQNLKTSFDTFMIRRWNNDYQKKVPVGKLLALCDFPSNDSEFLCYQEKVDESLSSYDFWLLSFPTGNQ